MRTISAPPSRESKSRGPEKMVIVRAGGHDNFMGWALNRRRAKYLATNEICMHGKAREPLFWVADVLAADFRDGTAIFHGNTLPAFVLAVD